MTGEDTTVDDAVDKAVARADTTRDTFRPVSVADRHTKRVRDDHAPNQALHDAIKAAAEDDDRIHAVNLMGSHAPGERDHEPRYHVRVSFENGGAGEPSTGPTFIQRLIEMGKVRVTKAYGGARYDDVDVKAGLSAEEAASKTIHDAVDRLTVHLRPVEARVEPIEVPVVDIPDDVFEDRVDRVPKCSTYECSTDATHDRRYQFPNGFTVDVPLCDECDEYFAEAAEDAGVDE